MKIPTDAIEAQNHEQSRKHVTERSLNAHTAVALLMVVMVLMLSLPMTHAAGIRVGRNVNLTSKLPKWAVEPAIAVDPRNPNIIAGAVPSYNLPAPTIGWPAYFRSTDGGVTWSTRLLPGFPGDTSPEGLTSALNDPSFVPGGGDVDMTFDRLGNLYYSAEMLSFTPGFTLTGFVAKFANDGADFVRATLIASHIDFPKIAVDTTGGPSDGNIYISYGCCGGNSFTRSTDGGLTFSPVVPIPSGGIPQDVVVDTVGNVYVASEHCTPNGSKCLDDGTAKILVSKSTDGGLTFGQPVVAVTIKLDPFSLPNNQFSLSGGAPQLTADANGIYIVYDDFGTGDTDVLLTRSIDRGVTWSNPLRVNDVTLADQFFGTITSSGGIISVAWYDSRLGTLSNGTITWLDVFYAESRDGGLSFSKSVRVTSVSFNPNIVTSSLFLSPFIGDYIEIAASPNAVHPIWTDNRNACDTIDPTFGCVDQDIYTATITP